MTTQQKIVKVLVDFLLLAVGAGLIGHSLGVPADRLVAGVFGAYTIIKVVFNRRD